MKRKDVRSYILSMALGDGCLFTMSRKNKKGSDQITLYGGFTMDHGILQRDYVEWKTELLQQCFPDRKISVRQGHNGKSVQVSVCDKRFRVWKKHFYTGKQKNVPKMLKFINDPVLAIAIYLMDDGYVEPTFERRDIATKGRLASACLRLCDWGQSEDNWNEINKWFQQHFDITLRIKTSQSKDKKQYYWAKMTTSDSLKLWAMVRDIILSIDSMKHKFRHIEQIYQSRLVQRNTQETVKI